MSRNDLYGTIKPCSDRLENNSDPGAGNRNAADEPRHGQEEETYSGHSENTFHPRASPIRRPKRKGFS
jgi:hypothetical protein